MTTPAPESIAQTAPLIKEIKTVELFDKRRYKFTFLNDAVRYITSVTTKLTEYREEGIERVREQVGTEEANRMMEEGGTWGSIVHHACFLLATGGAVFFEPPNYETVGIMNEEVASLIKQNNLVRGQLAIRNIPFLTIHDQFRYLQCKKFSYWLDTVQPEILLAETKVYSLQHDIAGRIDFLMRVKEGHYPIAGESDVWLPGGIILPDVKSGAWSNKAWLQMAAYKVAVFESAGYEVAATVGIHLKAKTSSGLATLVHTGEVIDQDFQLYQHVAAIYDSKHKNDVIDDYEFETVLLGKAASDAVFLGGTLQNAAAETRIMSEQVGSVERAAEFSEDLRNAKEIEDIQSPAVKVNTDFLRRKTRRI